MWQFFLYGFISALVTFLLYHKGKFSHVTKFNHIIITSLGIIFPFIDMLQTLPALKYGIEGNPLVNLTPTEYQLPLLLISHIGYSLLAFLLGWVGKSEKEIWARTGLILIVLFEGLTVIMNTLVLYLYGIV